MVVCLIMTPSGLPPTVRTWGWGTRLQQVQVAGMSKTPGMASGPGQDWGKLPFHPMSQVGW